MTRNSKFFFRHTIEGNEGYFTSKGLGSNELN